ncbi:MAG: hypothetical protein GX431_10140 [Bacteroidales bacterium]|nr:hypothetical protein [Bacteroidales bacterium]
MVRYFKPLVYKVKSLGADALGLFVFGPNQDCLSEGGECHSILIVSPIFLAGKPVLKIIVGKSFDFLYL